MYVKPTMESEAFVSNTYVAACESGVTYWFECNAGSTHSLGNTVYEESNRIPGLQRIGDGRNSDKIRSLTYYACGTRHEVSKGETFLDGYVVKKNLFDEDEVIPVLIWTEGGYNTHCTTELDKSTWEIAKS